MFENGPRVGKYVVDLQDLGTIGAEAIMTAVASSDVVAVDEIGPMELCSPEFRKAVERAVGRSKLVVGVVHWKASDALVINVKRRADVEVYLVTRENRENLVDLVSRMVVRFLSEAA